MIGVQCRDPEGKNLWVFSVHMPHQDNADDVYFHAVHELRSLAHAHRSHWAIVAGDFNADVGTSRAITLEEALGYGGYTFCDRMALPGSAESAVLSWTSYLSVNLSELACLKTTASSR